MTDMHRTTAAECRRFPHVPFSTDLTVVDLLDRRRYAGHSIDLSRGGIGFYAERFFPAGTRIDVVVPAGPGPGRAVSLPATVRWSRIEADGAVMGAEFDTLLGPAVCPELYERLCSC